MVITLDTCRIVLCIAGPQGQATLQLLFYTESICWRPSNVYPHSTGDWVHVLCSKQWQMRPFTG